MNGLSMNGLSMNGLSMNGLSMNGLVMTALNDPVNGALNQQFLSYLVSCALPADQSISLTIGSATKTFAGQLGLATGWGTSDTAKCDNDCQQWVSACLIARVNAYGHHIALSMRGDEGTPLSADQTEQTNYPNAEATYFGNIFVSPQERFACKMPGSTLINRVCGNPDMNGNYPNCVAQVLGTCDAPSLCSSYTPGLGTNGAGGYYSNCQGNGKLYHAITIYRQTSDQDNPPPGP